VAEAAEKEWAAFAEERQAGVVEIDTLRQRAAEARAELEAARKAAAAPKGSPAKPAEGKKDIGETASDTKDGVDGTEPRKDEDVEMDVEGGEKGEKEDQNKGEVEEARTTKEVVEREMREEAMGADDEDAVEY
jgi:hypothetical protein